MSCTDGQRRANEQPCSSTRPAPIGGGQDDAHSSPARRVLADVSPNLQTATSTPAFMKRALAGSPLKRSFTAATGGEGLTYLKRRRLADDEVLSDIADRERRPVSQQRALLQTHPPSLQSSRPAGEPRSPTEPDTPEKDESTQSSSAESKSFSSLINYDPSSQTSNLLSNGDSNAEMLRLRLRIAMYKVRTNQIDVPFASLRDENQVRELQKQQAIDDAVAELRREAQEVIERASRRSSVRTSPTPPVRSAPHNEQMFYETGLPSSPPASMSPDERSMVNAAATPFRQPWGLGSPRDPVRTPYPPYQPDLTSSVIKGKVAEGLLGLRNAA